MSTVHNQSKMCSYNLKRRWALPNKCADLFDIVVDQ